MNNPETVSTANILTANPAVDTVSKFITLTEGNDIRSNSKYGATIATKGGDNSIRLSADTKENLIQYAAGDG